MCVLLVLARGVMSESATRGLLRINKHRQETVGSRIQSPSPQSLTKGNIILKKGRKGGEGGGRGRRKEEEEEEEDKKERKEKS